jgi:glycosyltransferase involved in cell wall biosynthesis
VGTRGIPATYGGIEKICEALYPRMLALGYDVTVYCRSYYVSPNKDASGEQYYQGVRLQVIPMWPVRGIETFVYALLATIKATFSDAQIIHFHTQGPTLFSAIPAWLAPHKALVYSCNGIDWQRDKWGRLARWIIRSGEKASARYPHVKIAVSDSLIAHYQATYPGVVMRNIPNGVMPSPALPLSTLGDTQNAWHLAPGRYLMFCGRLVPEKAPETLIAAFKMLNTDTKLVIVGDSANTDDYVAQLKALAADDPRVIFTGYQYGEALQALYSNALAYVTSSKLEGLPLTLLEAMSYGLPIGVSDIGPHTEVLNRSPEAGLSFATQNLEACRQALERLVSLPPETLKAMGQAAQQLVSEHYTWEAIAQQTHQAFQDALALAAGSTNPPGDG